MTAVNEISARSLHRLVELHADGDQVLSIYLDLDPTEFATKRARSSAVTSVLDRAAREIEAGERSHEDRQSLRADLERVSEFLRNDDSYPSQARALALFSSLALGLFETVKVPAPVETEVVIASTPYLAPLAEIGVAGRYCVALVNRRLARILRGSAQHLEEVVSFGDQVHGRHQAGGWSQARCQPSVQKDVDGHLRHVADALYRLNRREPCERLLLAAPQELWPQLERALHPDLRACLGERLALDVADAGIEDVQREVSEAVAEEERARLVEQLDRLRAAGVSDGHAVVGLEAVLDSLVQRRVEVLLYQADLSHPGVVCPVCGWIGLSGERCPVDGAELEWRDVVEAAVEQALRQSADVHALTGELDLGPDGGIAAILRF